MSSRHNVIMKTTSYQTLIDTRSQYSSMLERLGIKAKQNRWTVAYDLVERLESARIADDYSDISPELMGRMRFALVDIGVMKLILEQFSSDDSKVFKNKFREMLNGAENRALEIASKSRPRDTQLELVVCARFRQVGLDAILCDPHPDILVRVGSRKYGFECKRIFSTDEAAIRKRIHEAIDQLNTYFFIDKDNSKRGMPLLALERHLSGGDKILSAGAEDSYIARISHEVDEFVAKYNSNWVGKNVAKNKRMLGVSVLMQIAGSLEKEEMVVESMYFGFSNSYWSESGEKMFKKFVKDIANHLKSEP